MTSDNPRGEDPEAIIDEVFAGMPAAAQATAARLPDRREAIGYALEEAAGGDIVLVAGKGHETTQTTGDRVLPFDDVAVVRELLWSL